MRMMFLAAVIVVLCSSCDKAASSDSTGARYAQIVDGPPCGNHGTFKRLKNTNPSRGIRATIRVDSTPNPGTFPQNRQIMAGANQTVPVGCSRLGGGGTGPSQSFAYTVVKEELL